MCPLRKNISIVIRSLKRENLDLTIGSLLESLNAGFQLEIIIVSTGPPIVSTTNNLSFKIIISNAKRIEAKKIGVDYAKYNKILFLDSDQVVSSSLLDELSSIEEDMAFIPERSYNRNFIGRLNDKKRVDIEKKMKTTLRIGLPVVPRFFDRSLLLKIFNSLPSSIIKDVTENEDSIIFYECLKYSKSINWVNSFIYNADPSIKVFLRKSFFYGVRNESAIISNKLPSEYILAIRQIQRQFVLNNGSLSISILIFNILRGIPYIIGTVIARIKNAGLKYENRI